MSWVGVIVLILLIWTATSVVWLITELGRKNEPNRWYDWILCPPVLVLASVIFYITRR